MRKGAVVTCEVIEVKEGGLEVKISGTDLTTFIKRNELARDRGDQRPERFSVGEKVDARITQFDRRARKVAGVDQGARSRRGEGGDRPVRLGRLRRLARRHPRRGAEGAREEVRREPLPPRISERKSGAGEGSGKGGSGCAQLAAHTGALKHQSRPLLVGAVVVHKGCSSPAVLRRVSSNSPVLPTFLAARPTPYSG